MSSLVLSLLTFVVAVQSIQAPAVDDAVTRERLESMLEAGDDAMIIATFRRHPGKVVSFFDGYLEGGLKVLENGGSEDKARAMMRRGLEFAVLASEAFGDDIFERYAASFASWSPAEQKIFREGQAAFGAGRKAGDDHQAAFEAFQRSYNLARSLHDAWGEAMAAGGMARTRMAMGEYQEAVRYGRVASTTYRRLQMQRSEVDMLLVCGRALETMSDKRGGLKDLYRAWILIKDDATDTRREGLGRELIVAMERAGQEREAQMVREQLAELNDDETQQ